MPFSIGSVIKKLNHIHCQISAKHQIPFPKPEAFWLSMYVFPTNARYKGCTWFEKECNCVEFVGIIENVQRRVRYRLNHPDEEALHKEIRIKVECPSSRFPEDAKAPYPRPKVEVLTLALQEADPEKPSIFNQIFGVQEELQRQNLDLVVKRGIFTEIILGDSAKTDSFFFRCPKLPHDMDARIGVRRNPKNPDHIEKIFGFNAIIDTSIEIKKQEVTTTKAGLTPPVAFSPVPTVSIKNVKEHPSPAGVIASDQMIRRSDNTPKTARTGSTTTDLLVICR